jgi:alginate O-acetyltransferase complex protein AlgI
MAIGLGRMIGFEFAENFRAPYRSRSITEFWRRWHISLSTWLRDYLYIPLGGNRVGRTNVNLLVVMVLGGLWHGASWSFVLWGLYHGLLLVFERKLGEGNAPVLRRLRGWGAAWIESTTATIRTVVLVMIGWVLFRAETLASAVAVFRGMAAANGFGISAELGWQLSAVSLAALAAGAVGVYLPAALRQSEDRTPRVRLATVSSVAPLFALSILKLVAESFSPFLYFRF